MFVILSTTNHGLMSKKKRTDFDDATERAEEVVRDKKRTGQLAGKAKKKAKEHKSVLSPISEDLDVLVRMVKAWAAGDYQRIPWKTLILTVGAVIYFLNPIDLIPDFIFALGFLDDIAIIRFVTNSLQKDLDRFLTWEKKVQPSSD